MRPMLGHNCCLGGVHQCKCNALARGLCGVCSLSVLSPNGKLFLGPLSLKLLANLDINVIPRCAVFNHL